MDVVIHLGFHKTGTTLIQSLYNTIDVTPSCKYTTTRTPGYLELQNTIKSWRSKQNLRPAAIQKVKAKFSSLLETVPQPSLRLSNENLVGHLPFSNKERDFPGLYASLEHQIERLDKIFDEHNVRYILSTRDTTAFIYSAYCDTIYNGKRNITLSEYIELINVAEFQPKTLRQRVKRTTSNPVTQVDMSLLHTNGAAYLETFLHENDAHHAQGAADKRVNQRPPHHQLAAMRQLAPFDPNDKVAIRRELIARLPKKAAPVDDDVVLTSAHRARIAALIAAQSPSASP